MHSPARPKPPCSPRPCHVPDSVVSGATPIARIRPAGTVSLPVPKCPPTGPAQGRIPGRWPLWAGAAYTNTVRIGYARVSGRSQDHQLQLDALAAADCREVVVETASSRGARPKLRATLTVPKAGDTLVIYKPDRIARSMKELLVLLEDELHAREVNLHILTGICAGLHKPDADSIADKMLFVAAAMAAEMERDLIRERTLDGLAAAERQGRKGGRPAVVDPDTLAVALARRARGESVTAIAQHLGIGRSTLYRALASHQAEAGGPPA
ncbi:MAG: recombinase family protein [Frankiaceae bacterium]